tara:strand:+ start:137 stop:1468 length:1332 start_codon:yes stop_codon:yes gene_type:complete
MLCFSQEKDVDGVSEKFYKGIIDNLVEEQKTKINQLSKRRGAPQFSLGDFKSADELFKSIIENKKNVGLLFYTFKNDSLKLSLISKASNNFSFDVKINLVESKIGISKDELANYIKDVNYLYSSAFFNRSPKKRGTIVIGKKNKKTKLIKSLKKLNNLLFPDSFQLENFNHLILLPALNIGTLPFAAFKIKGKYLIDRMSYSIAPNIYELNISYNKNQNKYGLDGYNDYVNYLWENALFVSNPKYSNNLEWSFPNLPGAEVEVNYIINKSAPTKFKHLSGIKATKENIIKDICDYDLIYFATHGINDFENPMDNSFLVLAEDNSEKPFITSREIQNIRKKCKLKADLVVLSACQTGLGKSHEGGTIGLARAFQIAGANHVLMSLWNIDDKETATFMKFFFDELAIAKELMPHAALRNAILKYKKEVNDDPKYWAAFSIFGVPY